jgi:phosphatidylglycerol---prolipoprotein diacylglyceryl transferase
VLALLTYPNIDPVIFQIPGTPLALRWYGLMYVLAFVFGYFAMRWLQQTGYLRAKAEDITNIIVYGVLGTFLGGRLGYALFYQFDRVILNVREESIGERMQILYAVWDGGMSFHGGVVGVTLAVLLYAWRHKANFWNIMDISAHVVPLGVAFVRIGNFINGELYGRAITDADGNPIRDAAQLPWYAMKFPTDRHDLEAHNALMRATREHYFATHPGTVELPAEAMRIPPVEPAVWEQVQHLFVGRYPSQLVQFLLEGLLVFFLIWILRRKFTVPGQLAGMFLILYAIFRIPAELIRQPDSQIDPSMAEQLGGTAAFLASIGLTMGQFLSVLIFALGLGMVVVLHFVRRTGPEYSAGERRGGFVPDTIKDLFGLLRRRKAEGKAD